MRHVNRSGAVKLRLVMPCRAAKRVHPGDTECTFSTVVTKASSQLVSVNVTTRKPGFTSAIFFSHSMHAPHGMSGLMPRNGLWCKLWPAFGFVDTFVPKTGTSVLAVRGRLRVGERGGLLLLGAIAAASTEDGGGGGGAASSTGSREGLHNTGLPESPSCFDS